MQRNPRTGSDLSYAQVHTPSRMDEFAETTANSVEEIERIEDGCAVFVQWKDGSVAVYYKKDAGWVIVVAR